MTGDEVRRLAPELAASFAPYLARWAAAPDGAPVRTPTSVLLPVRRAGRPAMLKVAHAAEERRGAHLLGWWDGDGAARVLGHHGDAVLLERAEGPRSLAAMARAGAAGDDAAARILCAVAARLHRPRRAPPPATLVPLEAWCAALWPAAAREGGVFGAAAAATRRLLGAPRDVGVLHGDLHHGNVLDFGAPEGVAEGVAEGTPAAGGRGWLAIDPKGLAGERAYDFAPLFANPSPDVALAPGRLASRATAVAAAAALDRTRLLRWVLAYAGLSAAWSLEDGDDPRTALAVGEAAAAALTADGSDDAAE